MNMFDVFTTPNLYLTNNFDMTDVTCIETSDKLYEIKHHHLNKRLMCSFYMIKDISSSSYGERLIRPVMNRNFSIYTNIIYV